VVAQDRRWADDDVRPLDQPEAMMSSTTHPIALDAILAAGSHGARAAIWITAWLIVLAAIVTGVLYQIRRRDQRRANSDDERRSRP
jgi:hypothetical protein